MNPSTRQEHPANPTPKRTGTRLARNLSAAVVAGIAAWSSYRHMVHVALTVGEQADVAYVLPLSVDGLLVVASIAMVDDRRSGRTVRWSARVAFTIGVLASLAANVSAAQPTIGARIVAAWPALALLLTVELLSRSGKLVRRRTQVVEAEPVRERTPEQMLDAAVDEFVRYRKAVGKDATRDEVLALARVGAEKGGKLLVAARDRVNGVAVEPVEVTK